MTGWLLPFIAGLPLSGCQVAHMALPLELLSETTEMTVEGRPLLIVNDSISFGPYRVTGIHREWARWGEHRASFGTSQFGSSEGTRGYEFLVTGPDRPSWDVQCAVMADWSHLETEGLPGGRVGVEFSSDQHLVCTLKQDGGERVSKLAMSLPASASETALRGVMMDGAARINISGTHELDSTPLEVRTPAGYIFHLGDRPVGAVEVINEGTVWLSDSVTPDVRSALAAASAALLLYQENTGRSLNTRPTVTIVEK